MDSITLIQTGLYFLELSACVTGFVYWKKIRHTYWRWFPVYLGVIVMVELTAMYISMVVRDRQLNSDLYRFFGIPIQFLFFYLLFYKYLENTREKRWPLIATACYLVSWIADLIYFRKIGFLSFSYTMGNTILLVLLFLFFIKFINSEEILKYRSSLMFWVCLGLLVFYLGTFPFFALRNTLYKSYKDVFYVYWYISFVLNYIMYILFAIAFIWGKPK